MKPLPRERASVVCVHNNKLLVFRAEDPASRKKYVFLPGGLIEENESPEVCVAREAMEETGYEVIVDLASRLISEYEFFWNGTNYLSRTHFFSGKLVDPKRAPREVKDANYHRGVIWLELESLKNAFSYTKEIQEAVLALSAQKSR